MDSNTSPSPSQIPDLIQIGAVASDTAINVQTDVLDPVIFSQREARFVLENKGILHSNSRITFASDGLAEITANGRSFFPAGVGIHSVIQRASLRVGTKTLCEIEDFADFTAYETNFLPPDAIKEREGVMSGRMCAVAPQFQCRSASFTSASNSASITESSTLAKTIQIDNGKDAITAVALTDKALREPILQGAIPAKTTKTIFDYQDDFNKPTYSILLADLFPFLKMNQLPLYMMSEQVSVHLTFTPLETTVTNTQRIVSTAGVAVAAECSLVRADCQMIADYIYYPQDMMEQYRQANANMTFTYVDYQFVKRTVAAAEFTSGLIQNLGGAGRIVNKTFISVEDASRIATVPADNLLGSYHSSGPPVATTGVGTVTTNLKYNDNFLYPIDVSNSARHFHNVFSSEGRVPFISRDLYRGEGQLAGDIAGNVGTALFEGYDAKDHLADMMFYTAYRLNKGERVNSRGIELYDTRVTMGGASTLRAWLQITKVATLRDGVMMIAFA
mgnify:CR=1 FL=1